MKRRWLKRLAAVVAVVSALGAAALLVAAANWYATRRTDARRLHEALAQLDADDPDWHVVGVVKAHNAAIPADDTKNAGMVALSALALRPASWQARQTAINSSTKDIADIEWDEDRLPHDDAFCSLYEVYSDSGDAYRTALATRRYPTGGLPFHFAEPNPFGTLIQDLQKLREVAALLKDYATVEAYLGRGDEALRAADASLHFAQVTLAKEPTLISQLVRMASCAIAVGSVQQTLAWTEPTEGLADLQAALARAAAVDGMTLAVRGERAGNMRIYDNVRAGALPITVLDDPTGRTPTWSSRFEQQFKRRDLVREQSDTLRVLNETIAAVKQTGPARRAACNAVEATITAETGQMMRSISKCIEADDRCKARLLCASVGLACERFRRLNGRWPVTLAEIPTSILPAIPNDPFKVQPLSYAVHDGGVVVFSVGPDGKNTAVIPRINPLPRLYEFRLWNPEARRRPPTPRIDPNAEDVPDPPEVP